MSLRRALLLALAYVLLLATIAVGVPAALNLRDRVDAEVRSQARGQADVVAAIASDLLGPGGGAARRELVTRAARSLRGRVLLLDARGAVLADSAGRDTEGSDYSANRPEIAAALVGEPTQRRRRSETLDATLLATAVPVVEVGRVVGAVRVTQSVAAVERSTREAIGGIVLVGAVVLLIGLAAGWVIARALARPLHRLDVTARRIAAGDLERRAPVEGTMEQRSLARSFNDMADNLQAALEAQRRFVADASHQLRTPLTGIRLRMEEARLDAGMAEVDRLAGVVDDLLVLSRAGRSAATAAAVRLRDAAQAVTERLADVAAERGIALTVAGGDRQVAVPPAALERVLDALVENAIAYAPQDSEVELRVEDAGIAVLDRGPGLAPGEEEAVFSRFHRGSAGRGGVPGTGLGLAIARQLARDWGGEVTLTNRPGGGARAVVVLP